MFQKSRYLRVKDGYWRMFIRCAQRRYLDELYIPRGTHVTKATDYDVYIRTPNHYKKEKHALRLGNQEAIITKEYPNQ